MSGMESDNLIKAVFQIIDANIDPDALFEEVLKLSELVKTENNGILLPSFSVDNENSPNQHRPGLIPTPTLAKQLIDISHECNKDGLPLLSNIYLEKINTCVDHLLKIKNNTLDIQLFSSMILKYHLKLEIFWLLHKKQILSFDVYLENKLSEDRVFKENLLKDLTSLCIGEENTRQYRQDILSDFVLYFVKKSFRAERSSVKKIFLHFLESILKGFLDASQNMKESLALPCLSQQEVNIISEERLKRFSCFAISHILTHHGEQTAMDSLTSQIDWKSVNVFGGKRLLLTQLFQSLECNEVMRELASHLENVQTNPSTVLTYLSIMFILFPKAPAEIKDYIKAQLATGLENSDLKKLTVAFLIARQSSAVGQDSFGSYSSWFESSFSSNCSLVSSRPKFSTLMKFLSSLVPSDGPEYLKVHIFKKPTFPSRCGDILEDYILLAKTRLKDLGAALFDGGTVQNKETSNPAEEDIQKMLVSYEETGKIPTSFFRAWMFRKPYFLEVLLPALLKPRCLPEIPDTRMKFIDEIFKSVELDPNLHKKYIQLCEQEKHSWMEVVFNADNDELETMILPPKEQMRLQLTKYCEGLDSGSTSQVSETLNSIIEAASKLLPTPNPIGTAPFQIDQTKPLSNSEKEFAQEIMDVFQKMADQRITLQRLQGLEKLFAVLADHFSQFQSVICRHIIFTLMSQSHSETLLIQALAWVLVILAVSSHKKIIEVVITNAEIIQDRSCVYSSLQEAMFHCLDIGENIHLVDIWSFLVSYARKAIEYFDHRDRTSEKADVVIVDPSHCSLEDVVQKFIIKQLHLLGERFGIGHGTLSLTVSDSELDDVSPWSHSLFSTTRWLTLSSNIKPTLSDWVEFELKIDPRKDNLPRMQRTSYLWKTSSSFLDVGSSVGYKDTATFCTDLFLNLAKYLAGSTSPSQQKFNQPTEAFSSLVNLLKRHIYQLPCSDRKESLWLPCLLQSTSSSLLNSLIRIIFDLPPYLVFCNLSHEKVMQLHVEAALSVVKIFSNSAHNMGGFLSLDATIFFIQSFISVKPRIVSSTDVDSFITHPVLSTSILVHYEVLNSLSLLKELNPKMLAELSEASHWAESLVQAGLSGIDSKPSLSRLNGAALFARMHNMATLSGVDFPDKIDNSDTLSLLYFLHHVAVSMTMSENIHMKQSSPMVKLFLQIISAHGSLLIKLLDDSCPQMSGFCCDVGLDETLCHVRDFCILRLVANVPAQSLLKSSCENITLSMLTAYSRILTSFQTGEKKDFDNMCDSNLMDWMKNLIDCTSSYHLQQVNLISPPLNQPGPHTMLYLYVAQSKRRK